MGRLGVVAGAARARHDLPVPDGGTASTIDREGFRSSLLEHVAMASRRHRLRLVEAPDLRENARAALRTRTAHQPSERSQITV